MKDIYQMLCKRLVFTKTAMKFSVKRLLPEKNLKTCNILTEILNSFELKSRSSEIEKKQNNYRCLTIN